MAHVVSQAFEIQILYETVERLDDIKTFQGVD